MSDCKPVSSKLDQNAKEFVPMADLKQRTLSEIKTVVEDVFNVPLGEVQAHMKKIKAIAELDSPQASHLVGEILAELTTKNVKRVSLGFRCFKDVRAYLPDTKGNGLEAGVLKSVKLMTQEVLSGSILKSLMLSSENVLSDSTTSCRMSVESSDVQKEPMDLPIDHLFGLVVFLRYLITNLNASDDCESYVCIPPIEPCIDFCLLVNAVCELQLHFVRVGNSEVNETGLSLLDASCALLSETSWDSLLYQLFDGFSHGLMYFNSALASVNVRVLNGAWQRTCSLDDRENDPYQSSTDCTSASYLSMLINKCLSGMRTLLVEEQLPTKILRSTVLDLLMYASEMAAIQNTNCQNWTESNQVYEEIGSKLNLSDESLGELDGEQAADFEDFLIESGQLSKK
ncbi:uncharacterized protein DC041_0010274 [Schistosoma bovis]|uniref:Uncharacterized protein n=1 Tax=Schistosoma bovis TaxID=6184 RepID=A0A430QGE2_SCHBO|nr:uncharacterized protein DC041_0010274 [Schistosoma bovis]CAH8522361.1 unnamed protein product [Schistosoma bovis]